jgi:VCBS repeat-containing protein
LHAATSTSHAPILASALSSANATAPTPAEPTPTTFIAASAPAEPVHAKTTPSSPIAVITNFVAGLFGAISRGQAQNPTAPTMSLSAIPLLVYVQRELQYTVFNRRPTANPTQTSEDIGTGVVTGTLNAADVTGVPLTYTITGDPVDGAVTVDSQGNYTYSPNEGIARSGGSDSFTVTIDDGEAARMTGLPGLIQSVVHAVAQLLGVAGPDTITVTVPVAVTPIDVPVTGDPTAAGDATGTVTGTLGFTDPAGSPLTYRVDAGPTKGQLEIHDDGTYTYRPSLDASHAAAADNAAASAGQDSFTVTATNGYGNSASQSVIVTITPENAVPLAGNATSALNADGTETVTPNFTDADGDILSYTVSGVDPDMGTVTLNSDGTFTVAAHGAAADDAPVALTETTFTVTADDGHGGVTDESLTVAIQPYNRVPVAGSPAVILGGDGSDKIVTSFADEDGDSLTYTVGGVDPTLGTVTQNADGTFTFVPTASAAHAAAASLATTSTYTFATVTITADDGHGGVTSEPVNILIQPQNTAPEFVVALMGRAADSSDLIVPQFKDADNDAMTTSVDVSATRGTVTTNSDGTYTYVPSPDGGGSDTVTIIADDGHGGVTRKTLEFDVLYQPITITGPTVTTNPETVDPVIAGTIWTEPPPVEVVGCAADPSSPNCPTITYPTAPLPPGARYPLLSNFYGETDAQQVIQNAIAASAATGVAGTVTGTTIAAEALYDFLTAVEVTLLW